jgi:transcription elongation GreA/GreB family factor
MQPDSLVKLAASGNATTVEEEWMRLIESPHASSTALADYGPVLGELAKGGRVQLAEVLAWTAVESVSKRDSQHEVLRLAGGFLQAIGKSEEMRSQVAGLYRQVYGDRPGFDELLTESGLAKGRPVRRAIRTLDVCLALKEGDYLVERDHDGAARVDVIDIPSWEFTITTPDGGDTLGAVLLADRFATAASDDFRVQRHFDPDALMRRLKDDPESIIIELCLLHDDVITSDKLEAALVPSVMTEGEWKKFWTAARAAIKKSPNLKIEGRAPQTIRYEHAPASLDSGMIEAFEKAFDPVEKLSIVQQYTTDSKLYGSEPSKDALTECYLKLCHQAEKHEHKGYPDALLLWLTARKVGELAGVDNPGAGAARMLRDAADIEPLMAAVRDDSLVALACTTLTEARPHDAMDRLADLLPSLPMSACDKAAELLLSAGYGRKEFEPIIDRILASPVTHFEALTWLWDGPKREKDIGQVPLLTLMKTMLAALSEARLSDRLPKEVVKHVGQRSRQVLSARRYERFTQLLNSIEKGLAATLYTQLHRLDNLGRTVHEDLIRHLRAKFPLPKVEIKLQPWEQEDVLWVTSAGISKRQEEIDHHVNVKMLENARAIGAAAQLGDLSENSEYKFALEERDLLRARLGQMNAEMSMAKVLQPESIITDYVSVGTRVEFERVGDGEAYEMTILGPWEAAMSASVFNYKAPLMQRILGLRVGDTVDFEHKGASGTYKVVRITNSLL